MRATDRHPGRGFVPRWAGAQSLLTLFLAFPAFAHDGPSPNRVDISPALSTSGQPTRAFLETLRAQGFEVVFVNIPVDFERPAAADFTAFTRVMQAFADRKVLVHCQMNFRASSMVFLHRVITLKEPPERAWDSVQRAWIPNATWKAYILATLRAAGIAYEPL